MFLLLNFFFCIHCSGAGATALEDDPPSAAVCHLMGAAIADHHNTVDVKSSHMPTGDLKNFLSFPIVIVKTLS